MPVFDGQTSGILRNVREQDVTPSPLLFTVCPFLNARALGQVVQIF
jgi:hypothetical protein